MRLLISLLSLFLFFSFGKPERKNSAVVLASNSYLKITGKTNVSKFKCEFDMNTLSDSILVNYVETKDKIKFSNAYLSLPNTKFNCGGRAINRDFRELLNTDQFPEIRMRLKEINKNSADESCVMANVEIMISGISNSYAVPVFKDYDGALFVESEMELDICDFNLDPPSKVMGLIKVLPIIKVHFYLKVIQP